MKLKIYTASKTKHADKWKALRDQGYNVISTWIDEAGPGETSDFYDLWERCIEESSHCDVLLIYREPGEELKGAWVELGSAIASGALVIAVGIEEFSISKYDIILCKSLDEAVSTIDKMQRLADV